MEESAKTPTPSVSPERTTPSSSLARRIQDACGVNVMECYQCMKCSAGCPLLPDLDLVPHAVVRKAQMGQLDDLLHSKTIWMCVGCHTCATRCPNKVDLPAVNDFLRQEARRRGIEPTEKNIEAFHRSFMSEIEGRGRVHELSMIGKYKMATGTYFDDMVLGMNLFFKGKVPLMPTPSKGKQQLRKIFLKAEEKKKEREAEASESERGQS